MGRRYLRISLEFAFLDASAVDQSREAVRNDLTVLFHCPRAQREGSTQDDVGKETGTVPHVVIRIALGEVESVSTHGHRQAEKLGLRLQTTCLILGGSPLRMHLKSFREMSNILPLPV